jgi:hypothetical protein
MGFFNRDDDANAQKPPAAEPVVALEDLELEDAPHAASYDAGSPAGIPQSGRQRIERMKKEIARGSFTSDLSVNEFLLVEQSGLSRSAWCSAARSTTSVFSANWSQNQEMGVLTQAMYDARWFCH